MLACLGAVLAVAAVLTWTATPQYSSTARLFISTSQSNVNSAYTGDLYATQRAASYADLTGSNQLADRVADRLGPEFGAGGLGVTASVVPETVILEISATGAEPERAAAIAQAYAEELQILVAELETPEGRAKAVIKATIVDDARVSDVAVSPQPLRNMALAGVLGLLLGVGAAVARELLDTSVKSPEDVAAVVAAPILGNIFTNDDAKRAPAEVLATANPWAEAFRVLRTNMQYLEVDHDQKTFVMTSSLPGEGKSTVAVNTAVTLSQAGHRVALVECDLRRPLIAERLELDDVIGTTSVLIGKVTLEDAVQRYGDTSLDVLACGPIPPNPSELLQSNAMEKLLVDLRGHYDIVILDAPPLLPVTDAALLAARTDGAIVVVRYGKTTRDQLMHAAERLESVDAAALGIVINMTPARRSSSNYGYGYGYAPLDEKADRDRRGRRRRI